MNDDANGLLSRAANIIADKPTAALRQAIVVLAEQAKTANANTFQSPSRAAIRKKLLTVKYDALKLASSLDDLASSLAHPACLTLLNILLGSDTPNKAAVSRKRLRTMAEDVDWLLAEIVPGGGGTSNLMDSLGAPRDVLLIAVGVLMLFKSVTGRWPSPRNRKAVEVCSLVARAAGIRTEAQDRGGGWERQLKAARLIEKDEQKPAKLRNKEARSDNQLFGARLAIVDAWIAAKVWDAIAPPAGPLVSHDRAMPA